jgi:hypothetical protein
VNSESGPVFFFEQTYDEQDGSRMPAVRESLFTTHHTEQKHSPQDVCTTWREHTYKTETNDSNAASSYFAAKHLQIPIIAVSFANLIWHLA